jgi:hypothetical protein
MVLKIWHVDNGKITYLKYTNNRNESRLVKLKDPTDPDRISLSEMDNAIELMIKFVSYIKKFDSCTVVNGEKGGDIEVKPDVKVEDKPEIKAEDKPDVKVEDKPEIKAEDKPDVKVEDKPEIKAEDKPEIKVEDKPEIKVEDKPDVKVEDKPDVKVEDKPDVKVEDKPDVKVEDKPDVKVEDKPDVKVEDKPDVKVEKWVWNDEYDTEDDKREVPEEVSNKLNLLLRKDEGRRDGVQYLIDKYAKKGVDTNNDSLHMSSIKADNNSLHMSSVKADNNSLSPSSSKTDIHIILKENVITKRRCKGKKKQRYSKYEKGIIKCVPEILEEIKKSSDNKILINVSEFAKKMGEEFVNTKPGSLYVGIKYLLFDYDIIVNIVSSKEIDINTNKGAKIFRLRMKNEHDHLPYSILKQRNEIHNDREHKE